MRGDKLRKLRRECNFSLKSLSEISGVKESEILNLENKIIHSEEEEKKAYILYKVLFEYKINMEKYQKIKEMENILYQEAKEYKIKNIKKIKILISLTIILSILAMTFLTISKKENIPNEKIKEDKIKVEQLNIIQNQLEKLKLDTQPFANNQEIMKNLYQLKIIQEELENFKFNVEKDDLYTKKWGNTNILFYLLFVLILIIFFFNEFMRISNKYIEVNEKIVDKLNTDTFIKDLDKDFSNNMMKINIYQLNAYNDQTKLQANKSFIVAIIISIIGFIILCLGLYFSYKEKTTPGFLTTGVGLIIEFVSGTIFYLYNKTIIKMGEYHKKLVLTQNISLALKASEDLELEDRTKIKIKIVESLLQDINKYLSEK